MPTVSKMISSMILYYDPLKSKPDNIALYLVLAYKNGNTDSASAEAN